MCCNCFVLLLFQLYSVAADVMLFPKMHNEMINIWWKKKRNSSLVRSLSTDYIVVIVVFLSFFVVVAEKLLSWLGLCLRQCLWTNVVNLTYAMAFSICFIFFFSFVRWFVVNAFKRVHNWRNGTVHCCSRCHRHRRRFVDCFEHLHATRVAGDHKWFGKTTHTLAQRVRQCLRARNYCVVFSLLFRSWWTRLISI